MTFTRFIKLINLQLSADDHEACLVALRMLDQSSDPTHDISHLNRMLDDLHSITQFEPESVLHQIDFSVLLMVLCWHDAWKSQQHPQTIFQHFFCLLTEGKKSAELFSKCESSAHIDQEKRDKVLQILPKHARFQLRPHAAIEAKILLDLDLLELFSTQRLTLMRQQMLNRKKSKITALGARVFYAVWIKTITKKTFYLTWSKQEFQKRREPFLIELNGFLHDL